jgi:hypothetical protein
MSLWFLFPKKTTEKFDKFLPKNLKSGQSKNTFLYVILGLHGLLINNFNNVVLWFGHFLDFWAEICQIFRLLFGKFKKSKRNSENHQIPI